MADRTHSHDTPTPAMSAETVPSEEFVRVPRELTERMALAGESAASFGIGRPNDDAAIRRVWREMIAAAPTLSASHLAKEGGEAGTVEEAFLELCEEIGIPATAAAYLEYRQRFSLPHPSPALAKGGDAVRERVARIIMENRDDGACLVKDWTVEARENAHVAQALRQADAVLAALSTPTEGPASQTEGMGGEVKAKAKQALYSLRFEGQPMSSMFSAEELGLIVDTVSAALTPPETAEAVPDASDPAPATDDRERLVAIIELFVSRIERNGSWDDGCFYFNGRAASELERPLKMARAALATEASR